MRRVLARLLVVAAAAALLAGCGSRTDRVQRITLAGLNVKPSTTSTTTTTATSTTAPAPRCTHLTASLRPPAAMPAPGHMPAGSFMARILRRGYLIAGVDQNTYLFASFNPRDGKIEGFEIDILHELAQAIFGNPNAIQFKAITTDERIAAVQHGSVDVVADAVTVTCKRRQQVDFSTVYDVAGQKLLVPSDSTATGIGDLAGKRVCATNGSTSLTTLEGLHPAPIPYIVPQRTDCLVALQQGLVAGVTSDDSILLGFKAQDPNTKIVGARFADEPYGMAINRAHPDFVRFVNGVLARMRADGAWRSIYSRWLGRFSGTPAPPMASYEG
jgi:polar amino acid transport system substrate-binding protein